MTHANMQMSQANLINIIITMQIEIVLPLNLSTFKSPYTTCIAYISWQILGLSFTKLS